MNTPISKEDNELVGRLVDLYIRDRAIFESSVSGLIARLESPEFRPLYHSLRWRMKDPEHLRRKLLRKLHAAGKAGDSFDIDESNLFTRINDLVGVRLLHLHTTQFARIHDGLLAAIEGTDYEIIEGPVARIWDHEYADIFHEMGVKTEENKRMYTSVHYVVGLTSRTLRTGEIQVRTLAEELWGEVDHSINYPEHSEKLACREQIKVLARATSTCTRLVDSIFRTHEEVGPERPVSEPPQGL